MNGFNNAPSVAQAFSASAAHSRNSPNGAIPRRFPALHH